MALLCFWFCRWTVPLITFVSSTQIPTVFFFTGHWTADDLHPVSGCLHQSALWQSIRDGCSEINVFPGVSDVSVALPAADWSQTSLHPQPAVLPGAHTDQVIPQKLFWQNFWTRTNRSWLMSYDRFASILIYLYAYISLFLRFYI